ncbi:MAG TPA: YraN family protein, partial [Acidiferrobacterales bacterium]|nr:YraN family protein [Acidiferrobacterales bacterium]
MAEPLSGAQAEALACAHLERAGLRLLTRNYRCPQGEIDLVMDDRDTLVFVEVRYRRSNTFGTPA